MEKSVKNLEQSKAVEIAGNILGSTVGIDIETNGGEHSECSGVHIGNGDILTTHHILLLTDDPKHIVVNNGDEEWTADIYRVKDGLDLMILKLNGYSGGLFTPAIRPIEEDIVPLIPKPYLASVYYPERKIVSVEYLHEKPDKVIYENGLIDPYSGYQQYAVKLKSEIFMEPGNSGSGIFNLRAELMGIARLRGRAYDSKKNLLYAYLGGVSVSALRELI